MNSEMIKEELRHKKWIPAKPATVVRKEALDMVMKAGGDVGDPKHVLGCLTIQFGCFRCVSNSTSVNTRQVGCRFTLGLMQELEHNITSGTLASDVLFQACLLDCLHRWNEDRGRVATSTATVHHSYSGLLQHTANVLGLEVLKRKIAHTYSEPRKYTGERIGMEYLYDQTGKVMEDFKKTIEAFK